MGVVLLISVPAQVTGDLDQEVEVHDIDPVDTYSYNLTPGGSAQFIFVVKHAGSQGNITILLSNTTGNHGWYVVSSEDIFSLAPNSSQVVRITIWPDKYEEGKSTDVHLRILAVKDSDSHEVKRTYTVLLPSDASVTGSEDDEEDGIRILGFRMGVPDPLDSKIGRFIILSSFWILFTLVVLVLLDPFIKSFTKRTETELDDIIIGILRKPLLLLIIIYGLIESLDALDPPSEIMDVLDRIYGIVFFTTVIYTAYKIFNAALLYMDKLASKTSMGTKVHHALIPSLSKVGSIIFFFIGLNVILGYLGMDLALLLGGMTIMGLVIAFAAQDTLSNFFGGIFLILEPNFKKDDTIILRDITYDVAEIGMRTTRLYDVSNHALVIIPNNILANEKIVTLTEPDRHIKMNIEVGVAYGTDVDLMETTLLTIAKSHPEIISEVGRMPFVRFQAFGQSSLDFKLVFWVNDLNNRFRVRHEIMKRVYKKIGELGIEIPFPQRVVHMAGDGPGEGPTKDSTSGAASEHLHPPSSPPASSSPTPSPTTSEHPHSPSFSPTPSPAPSDPFPPPPHPTKVDDPAATAEVKGETVKPLEEVIREQEEAKRMLNLNSGNIDSDGFYDAGGDDEGGDGGGGEE